VKAISLGGKTAPTTALVIVGWKLASPFQSARRISCGVGHRTFYVETACATYVSLVD